MTTFSDFAILDLSDPTKSHISYEASKFPGGEQFIRINRESIDAIGDKEVLIVSRITGGDDVMQLIMAHEAVTSEGHRVAGACIPYFPYGRQDRRVNDGEAFSVKVFGRLMNGLFDVVITLDNHSPVTNAVLNFNIEHTSAKEVAHWIHNTLIDPKDTSYFNPYSDTVVVLAPDAGAVKRAEKVAKELKLSNPEWKVDIRYATKTRDLLTGKVTKTIAPNIWTKDHVFVVDDICDGGRTFTELATAIKDDTVPKSLNLFVSHGIFSKGLEDLFGLYDQIATTDSFYPVSRYRDMAIHFPGRLTVASMFNYSNPNATTN